VLHCSGHFHRPLDALHCSQTMVCFAVFVRHLLEVLSSSCTQLRCVCQPVGFIRLPLISDGALIVHLRSKACASRAHVWLWQL
jgi:hypothetical protein